MSFTTRCPACGTMFRLAPDQLKMADGWVRCGHCADVFDATLCLETQATVAPAVPSKQDTAPGALQDTPADAHGVDVHESEWLTEPMSVARRLRVAEGASAALLKTRVDDVAPPASGVDFPIDFEPDFRQPAAHAAVSHPPAGSVRAVGASTRKAAQPSSHSSKNSTAGKLAKGGNSDKPKAIPAAAKDTDASDSEPGFVRQARRRAFWQSPGMRALLSLLALVLGLSLLLQWAVHERNTLAAWQPRLAPALTQLCAPLGCKLSPVRRIDAIVIDSSALVRRLGNFYAFDLVLKNTAPVAVAVPALELSLTDTRDAVIARRVFLPEELPGAPALLPAQDSLAISLRLSLAVGEAMPMAGYRALVFYP